MFSSEFSSGTSLFQFSSLWQLGVTRTFYYKTSRNILQKPTIWQFLQSENIQESFRVPIKKKRNFFMNNSDGKIYLFCEKDVEKIEIFVSAQCFLFISVFAKMVCIFVFVLIGGQSTISSFHQSEVTGCQPPPPHSHALPTPPVFDTVRGAGGGTLCTLAYRAHHTALCSLNTYVHSKEWGGVPVAHI